MTCKQCKYITACMAEADSLGQVFDPNYDGEHRCNDFVPFTNADRIRAMNDEELANLLTDYSNNSGWVTEIGREICFERIYEWLKQPTE